MHRIHHSTRIDESNSNFANLLPWWDRMFATYRRDARIDQRQMTVGLDSARAPGDVTLWNMLVMPFRPLRQAVEGEARLDDAVISAGR